MTIGFVNARTWLADVREHADPNLTCILVGNKVDLCETSSEGRPAGGKEREVTTEEGEAWAKEEGLLFVEASAKSGQNVELAFLTASRDILDKVKRGVFDQGKVRVRTAFLSRWPSDGIILQFSEQSPGVKPSKPTNNTLTLESPTVKQGCCG